jgi:hypothetical protein
MVLIRASGESRQSGSAAGDFELWLDFHGVLARVLTDTLEVRDRVAKDFSYFVSDPPGSGDPAYTVRTRQTEPDWDALPELAARVQTPRNHCYTDGDLTYLDYFGSALAVYDRSRNYLTVESVDTHRLHEITYLSLLSRVGELLERRGLHRLHALAVGRQGETALFMMDSGGGKSTLGLGFLNSSDRYELISEDSPLIDRRGRVHPFPLRFGVLPPLPEGIAEEHIYYLERMEFKPKYLIALSAFDGRIGQGVSRPKYLFIGRRRLGRECVIRRASRWAGFKALTRQMIVGVGLYQGLEFLLRSSPLDLIRGSRVFAGRLVAAVGLLARARVQVVELGRDPDRNVERVIAFLDEQGLGHDA